VGSDQAYTVDCDEPIIWPSQAPTTRTSRAASMASGVMVSSLLMAMTRATWLMRRSTSGEVAAGDADGRPSWKSLLTAPG
jgi:hypothetical protein